MVPAKKPAGIKTINLKISNNCFPTSFVVSFKIINSFFKFKEPVNVDFSFGFPPEIF